MGVRTDGSVDRPADRQSGAVQRLLRLILDDTGQTRRCLCLGEYGEVKGCEGNQHRREPGHAGYDAMKTALRPQVAHDTSMASGRQER